MKIQNILNIIQTGVSHNPEIKKKVILKKGDVPNLMTFSQAIFKPGQSVSMHKHETMSEVFYVQSGRAIFTVSSKEIEVGAGDSIMIEAGEMHSQKNPFDEDVVFLYFGVVTY